MPGPEPVGTTPAPAAGGESVIHLNDRRTARADRQEPTVGAPDVHEAADSPEGRLAQTIQALYTHRGRTLTDHDTAEAFDIAMSAARLILDGARARGGLGEGEHELLQRMVETARRVPDIL